MANELKHGDQGCSLTKAEFEGVGLHVFNSQATGDIVYAASSSQLSRLGIGSSNALLEVASGIPGWTTSPTIGATAWANANHAHAASNSGGTIAITATTGTLAVGNGGTGATTFTDGGVLLGSGSGAITALAVLTDGQMIVGDGSGDPVAESGATLRTSIGVGTGDTLSISGLTLSTDLSVANGGTGASTFTDGGVLLGSGTSAITAMAVLTDGQMIVGDGSGDPVAESGATLRTSIGVGTGDTLSISGLTLSTDLSVANGGTGASSLTANGVLIGNGTSAIGAVDMSTKGHVLIGDGSGNPQMLAVGCNDQILTACSGETTGVKWAAAAAGGPAQATQAEAEAESDVDKYIPPDLIRHSPGVAKAWAFASGWGGGSGQTIADSFNITSMSDDGTGLTTVTWADDFATADAYVNGGWGSEGRLICQITDTSQAVGTSQLVVFISDSGARSDANPIMIVAFGDQ